MEWILVLIQVFMLGGFLLWEGYFRQKGKNLAIKQDTRDIAYEQRKGENLATKQDVEEIAKKIEVVKNEISFENQRKHTYIEQRTNRFIEILHLVEELQMYRHLLLYYLYDNRSVEKLSILINDANKTLLNLVHEKRLVIASIDDEDTINTIETLVQSSQDYTFFICYVASNAISAFSNMKTFCDLAIKNDNSIFYVTKAKEAEEVLSNKINEFEKKIIKEDKKLDDDILKYLVVLKRLFSREFYLKFDFADQTKNPEL